MRHRNAKACGKCGHPAQLCECLPKHAMTYRVSAVAEDSDPWRRGMRYAVLVGNEWHQASYYPEPVAATEASIQLNDIARGR
jgi:hypothetical protein